MNPTDLSIFAVDDSAFSRKALETACVSAGYVVRSFEFAKDALIEAKRAPPALILTDLVMPEMSGMDLLAAIRSETRLDDVPVIMITARPDSDLVGNALDAGAFDFIRKPYEDVEVLARIRSALRYGESVKELRRAAIHDSLTGLLTHAELMKMLASAIGNARKNKSSVVFLMVDIDHFKKVNDQFGHMAGDAVLVMLSRVAEKAFSTAAAGRYGGEEFGIILPRYTLAMAKRTAEAFLKVVAATNFDPECDIQLTVSIGMADIVCAESCWEDSNDSMIAAGLVKRADDALYKAKDKGRNRIESA